MTGDPATWFATIAIAYGIFVVGLFSPGPNVLSVIDTSVSAGRAAGRAQALGIATGSFVWGMTSWSGLTTLVLLNSDLLTVVRFAGSAYLGWLAFRSFRAAIIDSAPSAVADETPAAAGHYYRRGLLVQMTNPKAAMWWIGLMAFAVGSGAPPWVGGTIVALTSTTSVIGHLAYAQLFSSPRVVAAYGRARRIMNVLLGLFFTGAAVELLIVRL